jgi:hypothetical protein
LTVQKDPAAEKLAEVLDELAKMIGAFDEEIVRYLSLYFSSDDSIIQGRKVLLGMEVGQSYIRVNEARGHCHKITNIYDKYLKRWFKDVLTSDEAQQLDWLFTNLSTADSVMIDAMRQLTNWLVSETRQTLDEVSVGNLIGANQRIALARADVRQAREELTSAMAELRGLQADFISVSGTV